MLSFTLAASIGAFSGILISPITTIYYDTGFLIGLKGFVGAIVGGMGSYPIAAAGAILVGLLEAFSSFWASAFKEVIVFTLIIPVLVWRSLTTHHVEEEETQLLPELKSSLDRKEWLALGDQIAQAKTEAGMPPKTPRSNGNRRSGKRKTTASAGARKK